MSTTMATKLQATGAMAQSKGLWSIAWLDSQKRQFRANLTADVNNRATVAIIFLYKQVFFMGFPLLYRRFTISRV